MTQNAIGRCCCLLLLLLFLATPASSLGEGMARDQSSTGEALPGALQVRSWEEDGRLIAEVSALLSFPFRDIQASVTRPEAWCEFVPLVFNIKACTFDRQSAGTWLTLYIGRKFYEPPGKAIEIRYRFQADTRRPDHFRVWLTAPEGPVGTEDYRIALEVEATADGRTRFRMQSSFRPSLRSKLATDVYLATAGRNKVGFSIKASGEEGPVYVDGVKGMVERNVMRYYLALKAYVDTLGVAAESRFEARLQTWYALTAQYPNQLYEMGQQEYLEIKRQERRNQELLQKRRG